MAELSDQQMNELLNMGLEGSFTPEQLNWEPPHAYPELVDYATALIELADSTGTFDYGTTLQDISKHVAPIAAGMNSAINTVSRAGHETKAAISEAVKQATTAAQQARPETRVFFSDWTKTVRKWLDGQHPIVKNVVNWTIERWKTDPLLVPVWNYLDGMVTGKQMKLTDLVPKSILTRQSKGDMSMVGDNPVYYLLSKLEGTPEGKAMSNQLADLQYVLSDLAAIAGLIKVGGPYAGMAILQLPHFAEWYSNFKQRRDIHSSREELEQILKSLVAGQAKESLPETSPPAATTTTTTPVEPIPKMVPETVPPDPKVAELTKRMETMSEENARLTAEVEKLGKQVLAGAASGTGNIVGRTVIAPALGLPTDTKRGDGGGSSAAPLMRSVPQSRGIQVPILKRRRRKKTERNADSRGMENDYPTLI